MNLKNNEMSVVLNLIIEPVPTCLPIDKVAYDNNAPNG